MLSPIVQRRPFPSVWIAAFGVVLYGWVFLSGSPHRSQAAEPIAPTAAEKPERRREEDRGDRPESEGREERAAPPPPEASHAAKLRSETASVGPEIAEEIAVASGNSVSPETAATPEKESGLVVVDDPAEPPVLEDLRGRLVDGLGRPLGEWEVQWSKGGERQRTQSSAAGTFVLQGIERGRHPLLLWKPDDLRSFRTEPIATSNSLRYEVVLCDPPRLLPRLEGEVRTRSGRRVSGALVTPVLTLPAQAGESILLPGPTSHSLDEGLLTLREIPDPERSATVGTELLFWVRGEGLFPELVQWTDGGLFVTESAELLVELPSRFEDAAATHLGCRGAKGEALRLVQGEGSNEMVGAWRLPVAGAKSLRFVVPLETTAVFLTRCTEDGEWVESATLPGLRLSPGRLNRLRFP